MTAGVQEARFFTTRYSAINQLMKAGHVPAFTPTRISVGNPRFMRVGDWPLIRELAPFGLRDKTGAEFRAHYAARLDSIGLEAIEKLIEDTAMPVGDPRVVGLPRPLGLCCFEDLDKPGQSCHRTMFREWWQEKTGLTVVEINVMQDLPRTDEGQQQLATG